MNNRLQVGGDHYAADYQHWDWCMDVRLGYFESAATKYIFRWYKKNGLEDLNKAKSYLIKAREGYRSNRWDNCCLHVDTFPVAQDKAEAMFQIFVVEADIPQIEADLCLRIAQWKTNTDLSGLINTIGNHVYAIQTSAEVNRHNTPLHPLTPLQAAKTGGSGQASSATAQPTQSSASVGFRNKPNPTCPSCNGYGSILNSEHQVWSYCHCVTKTDLPSPFGYDGEG